MLQYFGHPMGRANSLEYSEAGRDWGQEEKGMTEDEMLRQYHQCNGHAFEQTPEIVEDRGIWKATVHGVTKSWTQL